MEDEKIKQVLEQEGVNAAIPARVYGASEGIDGKLVPVPASSGLSSRVIVDTGEQRVIEDVNADEVRKVLEEDFGYRTEKLDDYDRVREVTEDGPETRFEALLNPSDYHRSKKRELSIKERELVENGFEDAGEEIKKDLESFSSKVEKGMLASMLAPLGVAAGTSALTFGGALPVAAFAALGYIQAGNLVEGRYIDSMMKRYDSDALD